MSAVMYNGSIYYRLMMAVPYDKIPWRTFSEAIPILVRSNGEEKLTAVD